MLVAVATAMLVVGCASTPVTSTVPDASPTATPDPTESALPSSTPFVPPTTPGPAVLVGAGDIATCAGTDDSATAALIAGIDGTVFTAGDNVYEEGTAAQFRDCYGPTWGRFLDRTLPAIGNHEYLTTAAAGYFGYFGNAAGDPSEGWYARQVGTWRVYVLNSNCNTVGGCRAGSPQEQWLRADLAANRTACALAIWHHPRFSSGEHGNFSSMTPIWQALYDAGAELVINGHDHDYERFDAQTPAGKADPNGIVEIIVGTGGRGLRAVGKPIANSVVHNDNTFGVLKLTLSDGSWESRFVPVPGRTFSDTATGTCH